VLRQAGVEAKHLPGLYYLPSLSIAAVVFFGGRQVIGGHLSIGQFVLFETLLLQLVWPLEALGWITNLGQRALASAGRSFAWLEGIAPLPEPSVPQHLPEGPLPVRFEAVHFAYGAEADGQRVALARALVTGARVVVLDDPLSSVDTLTERRLVRRLRPALAGRTVLVATQRLSTVEIADRAVVLVDGEIVENGKPADLIRA